MSKTNQRTVLVTGANRGIGFEVCKQLGERGFHVFLSARNKSKGNEAVEKLKDEKIKIDFIQMDVDDEENIKKAAKGFGERSLKLDVLINNAAIMGDSPIDKLPTEELQDVLNTNAIGAFVVTREFLPFVSEGGRIINVSSGAGIIKDMDGYAPAYSISKATLNAITKQFAASDTLKRKNIVINSVTPGWVRTEMGGSSASRSVEQGANAIVWLATEAPADKSGLFWRDKKVIDW